MKNEKCMLIIENDLSVLKRVGLLLRGGFPKYDTVGAQNIQVGLGMLRGRIPDLVFFEITYDWFNEVREIRSLFPMATLLVNSSVNSILAEAKAGLVRSRMDIVFLKREIMEFDLEGVVEGHVNHFERAVWPKNGGEKPALQR